MDPKPTPGQPHAVLTGDVVGSRKVADRDALQAKLGRTLKELNRRFRALVEVPLSVSVGDEFQGLLRPDGQILRLVNDLQRAMYPVELRIGIGIGGVSTRVTRRSQEMDGEAFLLARQAIEQARGASPDAWLWFCTGDETFDLAANAIARLLGLAKRRWKSLHWRRAHLRDQGWTEERIAKREQIAQGTLSESLRRAGYREVRQAEASLAELIERRWRYRPGDL